MTTPNGHVGQYVVRHLVRAGIRPRVLAHHPETLDPAVREHVDARAVDLCDAGQVAAHTRDLDACFLVIPPLGGPDPVAEYERIGTGVAEALAANRVPRTVLQSSVGAEPGTVRARSTAWRGWRKPWTPRWSALVPPCSTSAAATSSAT